MYNYAYGIFAVVIWSFKRYVLISVLYTQTPTYALTVFCFNITLLCRFKRYIKLIRNI